MPIRTDNLNLNLNLNLGAGAGGSGGAGATGYGRPRFNTEDMDKLIPGPPNIAALPARLYDDNWDPELRAWAYVEEFMRANIWGGMSPVDFIADKINTYPTAANGANPSDPNYPRFFVPDLTGVGPATPLTTAGLVSEVQAVADAALDRADRFTEILDQATGPGALNYWTGLLRIDPVQERNAFMLMIVARKIGEYVAMGLKSVYKMRRPSQVYPLLQPVIDPPDTPSFPSSHSLQAHLISYALLDALPAAHFPNAGGPQPRAFTTTVDDQLSNNYPTVAALLSLADRVARNREIAGVHYPMDSACGAYAAFHCWQKIKNNLNLLPKYSALLGSYAVGGGNPRPATGARLDLQDMP